jgi:hypothetical protein
VPPGPLIAISNRWFLVTFKPLLTTPAPLSQEVALGLGAQAGESKLHQVATKAGFKRFRRATETPFNMIFAVHA